MFSCTLRKHWSVHVFLIIRFCFNILWEHYKMSGFLLLETCKVSICMNNIHILHLKEYNVSRECFLLFIWKSSCVPECTNTVRAGLCKVYVFFVRNASKNNKMFCFSSWNSDQIFIFIHRHTTKTKADWFLGLCACATLINVTDSS